MGMDRHSTAHGRGAQSPLIHVEDVEEDERLHDLTQIGGAHQPDDGVAAAAGPGHDSPPGLRAVAVADSESNPAVRSFPHAHVEHLAPPSITASCREFLDLGSGSVHGSLADVRADAQPLCTDEGEVRDADEGEQALEIAFLMIEERGRVALAVEATARGGDDHPLAL